MSEQSTENIWKEIWNQSFINLEMINLFWSEIRKAYSSKGRFYHTLDHIGQMLKSTQIYENQIFDLKNVKLAIFYHDMVYSAKGKDNEERSAKMASVHLKKLNYPAELIEKCCNYILATKKHDNNLDDRDLNYFLDFDLEKLGSTWSEYENYSKQIRLEYRFYPDLIYKPGRRKVLEHFLNLERIYKTVEFYNLYEKQARNNLSKEMDIIS